MRVLVTGGTGFIGRALVTRLQRERHTVVVWTRSAARARSLLGTDVGVLDAAGGRQALVAELERCDAVVNLAGEPLMGGRWTVARRRVLEDSRIGLTRTLVEAMAAARRRPAVLVSGSAVGFYGDRGSDVLTEASTPGNDFLAHLCQEWERAAQEAEAYGVRVVLLRTGVVLGRAGGALAQMLPPFEFGLGGPIGSGRQYLPWIHLHDMVRIITTALVDERYRGVVNAVAPEPATSRDFARALGRALHRPAIAPVPALVLKVIFGEAAMVLLASQRVEPAGLVARQFPFEYPRLDGALRDLVSSDAVAIASASAPPIEAPAARYELRSRTVVDAPLEETFAFFSHAENLGVLTPAGMQFSIDGHAPAMAAGARIDYRLKVGPVPVRWRTRIATWEPGRAFVDVQEIGPYRLWWHEHTFTADGARTVMEDRVYYTPPLGLLGRLAHALFIGPTLKKIFQYRGDVIRLRFGVAVP